MALQVSTALSVLLTYTLVLQPPATPAFYYRETQAGNCITVENIFDDVKSLRQQAIGVVM